VGNDSVGGGEDVDFASSLALRVAVGVMLVFALMGWIERPITFDL
jgi:hypothetical protein